MNTIQSAPEATPQSRDAVLRLPPQPEVVAAAIERNITSIVHFTRIPGLVGVLAGSAVKARSLLPEDALVKHVYQPNVDSRLDPRWYDYVNLSVSEINPYMFISSRREHPSDMWVILEFSPNILGDPGVVFCTTNNIYPAVRRSSGLRGFKQMFAPQVQGRYNESHDRSSRRDDQTTDPQAEVLYPFELPLDHLHTVTAGDEHAHDAAVAAMANFSHDPEVKLVPGVFP